RAESEVPHQLASTAEAGNVTDLGDQPDGADRINATQCAQRSDHGLEAPTSRGLSERGRQPLHALLSALCRELVFGQRDAVAIVVEALFGDPVFVTLGPG